MLDVPLMRDHGHCMIATREYGMQAAIAMAGAALLFDLAASFVILVVCLSTRAEKKSANMQASSGLVGFIWRESIVYWLVVLVLHSVNMSVAVSSTMEFLLLTLLSTLYQCHVDHWTSDRKGGEGIFRSCHYGRSRSVCAEDIA